ncbi:MAG: hypothetical protein ABII00_17915 [Elusimicrobiota bacterium]
MRSGIRRLLDSSPRLSWASLRPWVLGFMAGLAAGLVLMYDFTRLLDSYVERSRESKIVAVLRNRASDVSCEDCLLRPGSCVNQLVSWSILPADRCADAPDVRLVWRNAQQVPTTYGHDGPVPVFGVVTNVGTDTVELVYMGSPDKFAGGLPMSERKTPSR